MAEQKYVARLKEKYTSEIVPALVKKYGYTSVMQVPHMEKIVINIGVGDATANSKLLDDAVNDLTVIAGQKPQITKSKKSIKLTWEKVKGVKGYQIQYSTSSKFKKAKKITIKNANITSKKIRKLKAKKKYYVRIRAIRNKQNGKWSNVKKITC